MKEFFHINVNQYDAGRNYEVVRPASLNHPKDHSVMFVTEAYIDGWESILQVDQCVVIWPENRPVPEELEKRHVIIRHPEPRQGFAEFFYNHHIFYNPVPCEYEMLNGAYIAKGAQIGKDTVVFPGAYIDQDVVVGNGCYIGSGVRLMGAVKIGNDCVIRENTVIGSDGLTRMRNEEGKIMTIPQFGGVTIEDNVQVGALTVIAKGAIDDTVVHSGCRIDNCCFISHNVQLGEDSAVVGETIMFGSSSTGKQAFLSGNVTVRDGIHIGEKAFVGMAANVLHPVADGGIVKGNPAK